MSKKVKLGIIVTIAILVGGLFSMKRSVKNITLIGMVHDTKTMDSALSICDSRSILEAQQACTESSDTNYAEISNLCKLRLNSETEKFDNKCLRFYRFVERARTSQKNVSEYLKTAHYEYIILENEHSIPGVHFDSRKTAFLSKSDTLIPFAHKYPAYEEEIDICHDSHFEKSCQIMKEFMDTYTESIMSYLSESRSKDIIMVMEQDHMKYLSCKDFNKRKFSCKEIVL